MGRSQREKGKRGERQAAAAITRATGLGARRAVQYKGTSESADIEVHELYGMHWEVKHVERESVRAWMEQAKRDAGELVPVVVHRRNGKPWLVTVELERINEFSARLAEAIAQKISDVGAAELPG